MLVRISTGAAIPSYFAGYNDKRVKKHLKRPAITCIWLWRVFLVEAELAGGGFGLPLEYFRLRPPGWRLEFDGSLIKGLGLKMSRWEDDEWETEWVASIRLPFDLKDDSSYQNAVEFLAVVVCFAIMARRGHRDVAIHLKGDSTTALCWALEQRFRTGFSRNGVIAFVALSLGTGFKVDGTEHVDGKTNVEMDDFSRGKDPSSAPYNYPEDLIERIDCETRRIQ